jgi:hypothetical protein
MNDNDDSKNNINSYMIEWIEDGNFVDLFSLFLAGRIVLGWKWKSIFFSNFSWFRPGIDKD